MLKNSGQRGQAMTSGFVTLIIVILALFFLLLGAYMIMRAKNIEESGTDIVAVKGVLEGVDKRCMFWKSSGLYVDVAMPGDLPDMFDSLNINSEYPCKMEKDKIKNCILKCEAIEYLKAICNPDSPDSNLKLCGESRIREILR